jgi:hypothetical protein
MSRGSFAILVDRPAAGLLIGLALTIMIVPAVVGRVRSVVALTRSPSAG